MACKSSFGSQFFSVWVLQQVLAQDLLKHLSLRVMSLALQWHTDVEQKKGESGIGRILAVFVVVASCWGETL